MAIKEQFEELLNNKLHHCKHNALPMSCVAKEMKKCAVKAAEDAEAILQYTTILEGIQDDQTAEMEMYGHISE